MYMDKREENALRDLLTKRFLCKHANTNRTGGDTDNWKIAIYERDNKQVAFYDKKSIHLILEHYDDVIPNVRRKGRAQGSQKLKSSLNVHVEVNTLEDAAKILESYYGSDSGSGTFSQYSSKLEDAVAKSGNDTSTSRKARLAQAGRKPKKRTVAITVFDRNPDVIAEVLANANGLCGECGEAAPFIKASDGNPYLEVHHKVRLADNGDDTVENAIALCPNCHRKAHYG